MKQDDVLEWFESLQTERGTFGEPTENHYYKDHIKAVRWIANVRSALDTIFSPGHSILRDWERTTARASEEHPELLSFYAIVDTLTGLFDAAHDQLKAGYLTGLVDSIRAETEHELLEQADDLAKEGYVVAASVIAGGALETRLRHLCERVNIEWDDPGSIAKYDAAIAKERNAGTGTVYSKTDSKEVTAWGGIRNDAAHDPASFSRTSTEVRVMISGIRQFLHRVK